MLRVGQGFDVHAFAENRPLILGGVNIPYIYGLAGHSDADVVIHAIIDALLGAAALGDIGTFFPDTDAQYKNIDSRILLRKTLEVLNDRKFTINNLDVTIIAEAPKILPYRDAIKNNLAEDLHISTQHINVKATTTEKLGFTGRKEGIACMVIALLIQN